MHMCTLYNSNHCVHRVSGWYR